MNQERPISISREAIFIQIIHWLHSHQTWQTLWHMHPKYRHRTLLPHPCSCLRQISRFAKKNSAMKNKWIWRWTTIESCVKKIVMSQNLPHKNRLIIIQLSVILQCTPHSNNTVRRRVTRSVASPTHRARAGSPVARRAKCPSLSMIRLVVTEGTVFKKWMRKTSQEIWKK